MIIDSHAHIYPNKIAEKATSAIGAFYDIKMSNKTGTPEALIENGKRAGIEKYLVHSCATKMDQVRSINTFIKNELDLHPEFIGFMTLHQDMSEEEMFGEVKWAKDNCFYGIKLHPDFQKFYIDDVNLDKIYRAAESVSFPILFHTGDNRYDFSKPYRLANVAKKFKNVRFIGAHFGGYRCWNDVDCYDNLDNVFFDTSSSLKFINKEKAENLIKKFGYEKFFFGTDFPMWDACEELDRFNSIKLSTKEKEDILGNNLKKFLGI